MRFLFRFSPKNYLVAFLSILIVGGISKYGISDTLPQVVAAILPAALLDYLLFRSLENKNYFPDAGLISGLIIALVLGLGTSWYIATLATAIAILSKHFGKRLIKIPRHIFNPAASGIVVTSLLLPIVPGLPTEALAKAGWWGETYWWLATILGLIIVWRVNKWSQVGSFLLAYIVLLATVMLMKGQAIISAIPAALTSLPLFFSFFMLTEPQTSPTFSLRAQAIFGLIAAIGVVSISLIPFPIISQWSLLYGLLLANLINRFLHKKII